MENYVGKKDSTDLMLIGLKTEVELIVSHKLEDVRSLGCLNSLSTKGPLQIFYDDSGGGGDGGGARLRR
jgi:hypothetical protein